MRMTHRGPKAAYNTQPSGISAPASGEIRKSPQRRRRPARIIKPVHNDEMVESLLNARAIDNFNGLTGDRCKNQSGKATQRAAEHDAGPSSWAPMNPPPARNLGPLNTVSTPTLVAQRLYDQSLRNRTCRTNHASGPRGKSVPGYSKKRLKRIALNRLVQFYPGATPKKVTLTPGDGILHVVA